ncbi:glutathione S-transferase family protein [Kineobactrum salinum]|uniref:Glutathione S-transferase family protein n=1 Tax=Kineobactrum salinum TaxID=2708301 RepID=A0A6C0U4H3_9GAMM|nr:glutathione S-transferase family protein [Kineobactrum salinum]QIB65295.1 glutathione S-transferase family protein [Kineobactrum salinum]
MKLYTYDPAPNPRRLQLFLDYKGIEVDTVQIDMLKQQQFEETFRKINPMCTVPALVLDDGTVLTEVIGACVYLDEVFPERPLMGSTPLEKAQVISWNHRLYNSLFHAIAEVFRNGNPAFANRALPGPMEIAQIPQLVERGKQRMEGAWRMMDRALARQPFLAGEHFTFADIDLLVCIDFARWIKESVPEECSHIQAWLPRARAAVEQ